MDFGIERSVEDNELVVTDDLEKNGEVDTNGNYDAEIVDGRLLDDIKAEGTVENTTTGTPPSAATKGRGLRKWRRIPREAGKETNSNLDSNRKRGMIGLPVAMKQRSDGSSSSTNAVSHALDHNLLYGDLARGSDFASRADSDNSEDQNSRSSTAASAPKPNQKIPVSINGKNSGVSVQPSDHDQHDKSQSQNQTKKARGGTKLKKENSISSMESDSRSSNFIFTQGSNSVTSNGRKNGKLVNYEEEDYSDDAQNNDIQTQKHETDYEDLAAENSWEVKEEKVNGDHDTLVDSIIPLHLAQEALEREVQKLRDVGKEDIKLSSDDSFNSSSIKEAKVMIELKNAKILELESILNHGDYEELLMRRIAAELEYLVISKTIQSLKLGHMDEMDNLKVQQKKLAVQDDEQVQVWKVKNMVCRYGLCFMIQLVLLLVAVYMFVLQFSSETKVIIPT